VSTTTEQEIRNEFAEWFSDAAARDVDALMTKIADDAHSFEHQVPLEYVGAEAIRKSCEQGFDAVAGEFRWDVPDLQVLVRDDIAVTWGLNRMRSRPLGEAMIETWSRGTRVFQKIDGRWKMIHQHVSFPVDPETGEARTDLEPNR
jgi:ketosteroid isomerase-like protein